MVIVEDDNGDDDDDDDDTLCRPYPFYTRFKGGVRADWRCSGCVVMIIIMTIGDAEDAR